MLHENDIKQLYTDFNKRDINSVLNLFDVDVKWPNGWEGGYVHGHHQVRDYWTRQWTEIDPLVIPVGFNGLADGRLQVEVKQTIKDKNGQLIAEGAVMHIYTFRDGLISRMDIEMVS